MKAPIVLRKVGGVFAACWRTSSMPSSFAAAGPSSIAGVFSRLSAFVALLLVPLAVVALLVAVFLHPPAAHSSLAMLAGAGILGNTVDAEVKGMFDKLGKAFADFREANDERIKQLEAKGTVDPLLNAKVDKANNEISSLQNELKAAQARIKEVETTQARVAPAGSPEAREKERAHALQFYSLVRSAAVENVTEDEMVGYRAYVKAQAAYLRRGPAALNDSNINAALQTGAAPAGGFWLAPETTARMLEWIEDISTLRSLASVSPIGTDTYEGYYDLDEADSGWVGETDSRPETNAPRIDGKFSFPIHEQYANPRSTQKMLDDAQNDVEAWLARKAGTKMGKRENNAFVLGNGVNKPRGFATYAAGTPARTSVDAYRVIRQIHSGAAGGFAATKPGDVFIDMIQSLPSELRKGAVFAMNQLTAAATRKLVDGQGNYLFIPNFATNPNGSILGHSIAELNDMADIAANSLSIAFANFAEGYEIKDHKIGVRLLRDPFTQKPYVQFYTTKRVGGDIVNFQAITLMKFAV